LERFEGEGYFQKLGARAAIHEFQGNLDSALDELDKLESIMRGVLPEVLLGIPVWRAQVLSKKGDFAKARLVAEAWRRDMEKKDLSRVGEYWFAVGCIEFEEGNFSNAIANFERDSLGQHDFGECHTLGRAYLQNRNLDKAVAILEKAASRYDDSHMNNPLESVTCHYYLGMAYEKSGWMEKAIEQYRTFLDIWKDADSGIKEVVDARARLARLTS
jgi:tetratricopeptide (TPR) repeat protein